jgi:hypothetical protein
MAIVYNAEPTAKKFHRSTAFVRGLRGPIGTGKSVTCCMEIIRRGVEQEPFNGVRRTRWAAVRNSYPELKSTTIKTWEDWAPGAVTVFSAPIVSVFERVLPDGTKVEIELLFLSLDRPDDVKKLKSLDLTGIWLNEVSELPKAVFDMATGRVGRFPSKAQGSCTWSGVIMDTNSPDDDHWYYMLAEEPTSEELEQRADLVRQLVEMGLMQEGQPLYEFFAQPGALIKTPDGKYMPNPEAENVQNHSMGYGYWLRQVAGKTEQWIKVFILGQYGSVHDGKPVYPEFNEALHVRQIYPLQGVKLVIGLDFGLTPAAVITQTDAKGRLLVLDELCGEDMAIRQFMEDLLIPYLVTNYNVWWQKKDEMILLIGDPAGEQKAQTDEKSCFQEVRAKNLKIRAAKSNAFQPRRGAVAWFLSKLTAGQPAFLLDEDCKTLRKGFNGGYKYRRIQVTGDERYTDEPVKNRFSHPHDALQYAAMETGGIQAVTQGQRRETPRIPAFQSRNPAAGMLG